MKKFDNILKINRLYLLFLLLLSVLIFQSCAPVFSELQSARMVGKNNTELLPYYSSTSASSDGDTEKVQNHTGVQIAYGISDKVDIRARYERIWLKEGDINDDGVSIVGIGPKFSLVKNQIAIYTPIGRRIGEGSSDSWEFQPSVLLTLPIEREKIEVTIAPKYLITFCEKCDDFVAFNLGLSLSSDLNKWAIRPEFGMLFNPGEMGNYSQFSIGFYTTLWKKNSKYL